MYLNLPAFKILLIPFRQIGKKIADGSVMIFPSISCVCVLFFQSFTVGYVLKRSLTFALSLLVTEQM